MCTWTLSISAYITPIWFVHIPSLSFPFLHIPAFLHISLSLSRRTHTHTWSPLEHLLLWELGFTNITSYYQQVSINNITHTLFATRHTGLSAQHVEYCNYQRSAAKSTTLCQMCSVPVGKEHILKKLDVKIINGKMWDWIMHTQLTENILRLWQTFWQGFLKVTKCSFSSVNRMFDQSFWSLMMFSKC